VVDTAEVITGNTPLQPGVYRSIDVRSGGVLTLEKGIYVVTNFTGFTVRTGGRVIGTGDGATIFLACGGYPAPCGGSGGARFRLENGGDFQVSPPATGEYAGLSIFADKGNTRTMRLLGPVTLDGAVYAASGRLVVNSPEPVAINALVAVDRLLKDGAGQLRVNYNPSSPLIGIGRPVLLR
jgi:hypothetical protein